MPDLLPGDGIHRRTQPRTPALNGFRLKLSDFRSIGSGLHRPECVLTTACGDLYVSDKLAGVQRISPDGSTTRYSGRIPGGDLVGANGFAMLPDGSFLIAPLVGGGVFRLYRNGQVEPFLLEADGRPMSCPNFVLLDSQQRVWVCCLTQQDRTTVTNYARDLRDGYIVLIDQRGARIVADNIGYPNEVKIDPTGRYLYTNETMAARLLRYEIQADGTLGPEETITQLDESNMFDGFAMDAAGGAWVTTLISNRLWYIGLDGEPHLLIEDAHAEQLDRFTRLQKTPAGVPRSILYEEHGSTLRNIASVAFGGSDLRTVYLGNLTGDCIMSFRSPVAGMKPAHWAFGPFD